MLCLDQVGAGSEEVSDACILFQVHVIDQQRVMKLIYSMYYPNGGLWLAPFVDLLFSLI